MIKVGGKEADLIYKASIFVVLNRLGIFCIIACVALKQIHLTYLTKKMVIHSYGCSPSDIVLVNIISVHTQFPKYF